MVDSENLQLKQKLSDEEKTKFINFYEQNSRRTLRSETIFDNWKSFKMMKNVFYFTLKLLSFSRSFCFDLFVHV